MTEHVLDRKSDAQVQPGYTLVVSEVEFLSLATEEVTLHIRGEHLCLWAETFFRGRRIAYREAISIKSEVKQAIPSLSDEEVEALQSSLGDILSSIPKPLSAQKLLNALHPSQLWSVKPSLAHLAEWLLWVVSNQPSAMEQKILQVLVASLESTTESELLNRYRVNSTLECAEESLDNWLGIGNRNDFLPQVEFPLNEIPQTLLEKARQEWNLAVIESHGKFFESFENQVVPFSLKKLTAVESYKYFLLNSHELTQSQLIRLAKYLSNDEANELRRRLEPLRPGTLPETPEKIITWFREEYLPYREWENSFPSEPATEVVLASARQFSEWYLANYPKALSGNSLGEFISFNKSRQVDQGERVLILMIVLDGLHAADARNLLQSIRSKTSRLTITSDELVFAPIPTITEFAKEALFRGVPPEKIPEAPNCIGVVLPEDRSPSNKLADGIEKGLYLWRVLEPDKTYHSKNRSETLHQDIAGRLEAEAMKIEDIVKKVSENVQLQIIITTDHGRLLGNTKKILERPKGMESHGRVAWGKTNRDYPADGYAIDNDVAYLFSESFGMLSDMAIPLSELGFKGNDDQVGSERYPHGGLFPEEVLIPWVVMVRDYAQPTVFITVTGNGRARSKGTIKITALNASEVNLILDELTLTYRSGATTTIPMRKAISAQFSSPITYEMEPWPSGNEVDGVAVTAKLTQPNGLSFVVPAKAEIESKDLYKRENILEDLF